MTTDQAIRAFEQAETKWSARVEKLQAEVERLKLDRERLDWLQHNALAVTESTDLRAAIDAAIAKEKDGN